jgi:glutaminase
MSLPSIWAYNHSCRAAGLLLNQLGNAEGAVQEWELACKHYKQAAALSPEIESLALANLALANCEMKVCGPSNMTYFA